MSKPRTVVWRDVRAKRPVDDAVVAEHVARIKAEERAHLAEAPLPEQRVKLGDRLAALGREVGVTDDEVDLINGLRDRTPAEPVRL